MSKQPDEELQEKAHKIVMEAMHTATAPQFGSSYQPYSSEELEDQIIALVEQRCLEARIEQAEMISGWENVPEELSKAIARNIYTMTIDLDRLTNLQNKTD